MAIPTIPGFEPRARPDDPRDSKGSLQAPDIKNPLGTVDAAGTPPTLQGFIQKQTDDTLACLGGNESRCWRADRSNLFRPDAPLSSATDRLKKAFVEAPHIPGYTVFLYDPTGAMEGKPVVAVQYKGENGYEDILFGKLHVDAYSLYAEEIRSADVAANGYFALYVADDLAQPQLSHSAAVSRDGSEVLILDYPKAGFRILVDAPVGATETMRKGEMWRMFLQDGTNLPAMMAPVKGGVGAQALQGLRAGARTAKAEPHKGGRAAKARPVDPIMHAALTPVAARKLARFKESGAFRFQGRIERDSSQPSDPVQTAGFPGMILGLFGGWRGTRGAKSSKSTAPTSGVFVNGKKVSNGKITLAINSTSSELAKGIHRVPVRLSGAEAHVSFGTDGWHVTNMSSTVPVRVKEVGQRQTDLAPMRGEISPQHIDVPSASVRPGKVILEFGTGKNREIVELTLPDLPPPPRVTPAPASKAHINRPPRDPVRGNRTMVMPRARGGMTVTAANEAFVKSRVFVDAVANTRMTDRGSFIAVHINEAGQIIGIVRSGEIAQVHIRVNPQISTITEIVPIWAGSVSPKALAELQHLIGSSL